MSVVWGGFDDTVLDFSFMKECPICDCKFENRKCKNGCFTASIGYVRIFDKNISSHKKNAEQIIEEVKYWRTNNRYLIRIMGVNNE